MFGYLTPCERGISSENPCNKQVRNIEARQCGSYLTLMLLKEKCGENIEGLEVKNCRIKRKTTI